MFRGNHLKKIIFEGRFQKAMFSLLNCIFSDTPMFSFVPYLWFRSLILRVISFVVITTPHVPQSGLSTGSASSHVTLLLSLEFDFFSMKTCSFGKVVRTKCNFEFAAVKML